MSPINHRGWTVLALPAMLLIAAYAGVSYHRRAARLADISAHYRGLSPIPANAPRIPSSELDRLLVANFTVIRDFRQIPSAVLSSFVNLVGQEGTKPPKVNPGAEMSTDLILPGVPS